MATKENSSTLTPGEVIDKNFDIQAIALAAAALAGIEIEPGCSCERAMRQVGDMLATLAHHVDIAALEDKYGAKLAQPEGAQT
jgi:hypothetical protein